jgi:NodT family efflux transporter outer membrane factor (OMF) lipoprotein
VNSHRSFLIVLPCLFLFMSGCRIGPDYSRPSAPLAPAFKEAVANPDSQKDGWKIAEPKDQALRGNWWEIYEDPRLNALEDQISSSNQTLKIAEAKFRQARAAIQFARAAEAPNIQVSPGISAVRNSANEPYFPSSLVNGGEGDFVLPIDLSWEIDLWGRIRRSVTSEREQATARAADMASVQLCLQAELALDYFQLRSADAEKKLLDDTVEAYTKALQLTENRYKGGAAPKSDVAQARTQFEDARVLDSDVMVQRAQLEHAIAILIGRPPANFTLLPDPIDLSTSKIAAVPTVVPSALLERRPDVAATERRMAAANEQIGIAQSAFYPTLGLSATAGFQGTSALNWLNWPSRLWAVGPGLSETLFDAGRRRATKESALAGYDANVANYRQTVLTAFQQVEDNLTALRILSNESQQQKNATMAAEESLRLSENRYEGGVATYLQVVTSQTTALGNQRNDIEIRRRQLDASVLLIKALGGDWNTTKLPKI